MKRALAALAVSALAYACGTRRPPMLPPYTGTAQEGVASWYGLEEEGRRTSSGEIMDPRRLSAAHPTLPFGTQLRVTDLDTGRSVVVVVNDRGPFARGRIVDLSWGAASALGMVEKGVARVKIVVLSLDPALLTARWVVQVGSFRDETQARILARDFEERGYAPVRVLPFDVSGQPHFRVQVGSFVDRGQAEALAERLERLGHQTLVTQTNFPASS